VNNLDVTNGDDLAQWIYRAKIKMLFVNQKHSWLASLIVSAILASFTLESNQVEVGISWWLFFVIITLIRTRITRKFCSVSIDQEDYSKWDKRFFWATVFAGFGWGVGGLVI